MVFKVNARGAADFTNDSSIHGWGAELNRFMLKAMQPADRNQAVQQILSMFGQSGSGVIETDALDSTANTFKFTIKGHTSNLVNLPGPTGVPTLSSLAGGIGQSVFSLLVEKDRTQPFTCLSGEISETARLEFPAKVKILAVPKAVSVKQAGFDYRSTYVKKANTVLITRQYVFAKPEILCTTSGFAAMQPAIEGMVSDLKSQVLVQVP